MTRIASLILAALTAAACAVGPQPGSSEGDVRASMGKPALEVAQTDGSKRLVYPRGPMGTETYVADIGADGRLRGVSNVLTDDVFEKIRPGLTEQDVKNMIGPPGETMYFPMSNTHAWDYRYIDTWSYLTVFSVTFDAQGVVVSKIKRRIEGRDSRQ
ncbi:MAG TPA: outer membrane protein assembly factor BamE [Usitatibacter sp.]|nr:outer membrane protein assembly factor BamE [Usitatibacter sp.]